MTWASQARCSIAVRTKWQFAGGVGGEHGNIEGSKKSEKRSRLSLQCPQSKDVKRLDWLREWSGCGPLPGRGAAASTAPHQQNLPPLGPAPAKEQEPKPAGWISDALADAF